MQVKLKQTCKLPSKTALQPMVAPTLKAPAAPTCNNKFKTHRKNLVLTTVAVADTAAAPPIAQVDLVLKLKALYNVQAKAVLQLAVL